MATKLEKLNSKRKSNNEKIFEFQEKIKILQKENSTLDKEIQKEQDKQILNEIKEKNISIEELKNLLSDKANMYKNNNHSDKDNNIDNQERRF